MLLCLVCCCELLGLKLMLLRHLWSLIDDTRLLTGRGWVPSQPSLVLPQMLRILDFCQKFWVNGHCNILVAKHAWVFGKTVV